MEPPNFEEPPLEGKSVYDRIFELPERTFSGAEQDFSGKHPLYGVIGCEGTRSKCAIKPTGDLVFTSQFIKRAPRSDTDRVFWAKTFAIFQIDWQIDNQACTTDERQKPAFRGIEQDYLPISITNWKCFDTEIASHSNNLCNIITRNPSGRRTCR